MSHDPATLELEAEERWLDGDNVDRCGECGGPEDCVCDEGEASCGAALLEDESMEVER